MTSDFKDFSRRQVGIFFSKVLKLYKKYNFKLRLNFNKRNEQNNFCNLNSYRRLRATIRFAASTAASAFQPMSRSHELAVVPGEVAVTLKHRVASASPHPLLLTPVLFVFGNNFSLAIQVTGPGVLGSSLFVTSGSTCSNGGLNIFYRNVLDQLSGKVCQWW